MPNYQNSKIYKIWSPNTDKIYIGSTTQTLAVRFAGHKIDIKRGKGCSAKEILELSDCRIDLIENYPCNNRDELNAREGFHMLENKHLIVNENQAGAYGTGYNKEYHKQHELNYRERRKELYQLKKK